MPYSNEDKEESSNSKGIKIADATAFDSADQSRELFEWLIHPITVEACDTYLCHTENLLLILLFVRTFMKTTGRRNLYSFLGTNATILMAGSARMKSIA